MPVYLLQSQNKNRPAEFLNNSESWNCLGWKESLDTILSCSRFSSLSLNLRVNLEKKYTCHHNECVSSLASECLTFICFIFMCPATVSSMLYEQYPNSEIKYKENHKTPFHVALAALRPGYLIQHGPLKLDSFWKLLIPGCLAWLKIRMLFRSYFDAGCTTSPSHFHRKTQSPAVLLILFIPWPGYSVRLLLSGLLIPPHHK